ncbi:MAG TPA: twin-arginine translocase TatA/TatE family subunit [Cellvibrio sp.]|nr:twin-arginine translocase TatA/TatE family subunit [Cellvibrio sp.]
MSVNHIAGAGNFGSPTQLLILLAIVVLLFGGKRLRNLGGDIGTAIKGFKNSVAPTTQDQEPQKITVASSDTFVHEKHNRQEHN